MSLNDATANSWVLGGVKFANFVFTQDRMSQLINTAPAIGATSTDSLATLLNKSTSYSVANLNSSSVPGLNFGNATTAGIGYGLAVYANMVATPMTPISLTPYNAGVCRAYGTNLGNIFSSGNVAVRTPWFIKEVGDEYTLTITDNTGTNVTRYTILEGTNVGTGRFSIVLDTDPYQGSPTREGMYSAMIFDVTAATAMTPNNFSSGVTPYSYQFEDVTTLRTNRAYTFYVDSNVTPTVGTPLLTSIDTNTIAYVSGVPRVIAGAAVTVTLPVANAVSEFYANGTFARVWDNTDAAIIATNYVASSGDIAAMFAAPTVNHTITLNTTIAADVYTSNLSPSINAYNAAGTASSTVTFAYASPVEVDTKSIAIDERELRVYSGYGQYPDQSTVGSAYDSYAPLCVLLGGTPNHMDELQFVNGRFSYPGINYSVYYPAGSDYRASTTIAPAWNSTRWCTQAFAINDYVSSAVIQIVNPTFDLTSAFEDGTLVVYWSDSTSGSTWFSATDAFVPGGTLPYPNGRASYSEITGTSIEGETLTFNIPVTAGYSTLFNTVYVRVGLVGSSNTVAFASINFTVTSS